MTHLHQRWRRRGGGIVTRKAVVEMKVTERESVCVRMGGREMKVGMNINPNF